MLRTLRIVVSVILFSVITLYFLDFAEVLPLGLVVVTEWQVVPALLALNGLVVLVLVVLTLLFGRVYCSSLCPLGIYQDAVSRLKKWVSPRKKKKRYKFLPPLNWVRYGFLAVVVLGFVAGLHVLVGLLDPYSAFGRMTVHLFKPVYQAGNNLLFSIFTSFDNHTFYKVSIYLLSVGSLVVALVTLGVVTVMAWRNGRIYCNTVCPVGTGLGLLSRFSLFQIRFKASDCTLCGRCARDCKSSCIDFKNMTVDMSRCVSCFNCIEACKEGALSFSSLVLQRSSARVSSLMFYRSSALVGGAREDVRFGAGNSAGDGARNGAVDSAGDGAARDSAEDAGRRRFLMALGVTGVAAVKMSAVVNILESGRNGELTSGVERQGAGVSTGAGAGNSRQIEGFAGPHVGPQPELLSHMRDGMKIGSKRKVRRSKPIMPPGAVDFERFTKQCTSCHLCVAKCPAQVIKPALLDYGLGGMMQPMMNFDNHYCNYDCTICSDVCPTDALLPLSLDAKHHNQMGVVQLYLENCIVYTDDTSCGACSEHCPTQAVRMVPYKDGLTMPEIHPEICVGCGGCEYICPALPWKAIFVDGIRKHETIELEFEEAKEYEIDDFGF